MQETAESLYLSIAIARDAREAYDFLCVPENFPKWASGLGTLSKSGKEWVTEMPEGPMKVRFSERNAYGVLDHWVTPASGPTIYIPLRVIRNGDGCELVLTLFRQPGMSEEKFAADGEWVMRDLAAAKAMLEGNG
jgi:hypothetical protein